MEREIVFWVSVSGLPETSINIKYTQLETPDELKNSPSAEGRFIWNQAIEALKKEVGHSDFDVVYWDWIK